MQTIVSIYGSKFDRCLVALTTMITEPDSARDRSLCGGMDYAAVADLRARREARWS